MALRFKLDENIPGEAVALLREAGHDVRTILDQGLGGRPDDDVSRVCRDEARVLVTLDLDFGDIRTYPPADHAGIWVLRPATQSVDAMRDLIRRALDEPQAPGEPVDGEVAPVGGQDLRLRGEHSRVHNGRNRSASTFRNRPASEATGEISRRKRNWIFYPSGEEENDRKATVRRLAVGSRPVHIRLRRHCIAGCRYYCG